MYKYSNIYNIIQGGVVVKAEVYYFTGTGNSLKVAKDIAREIDGELVSIPKALSQGTIKINAEVAVVVFPVYMWGIPLIIERFVKSIENLNDKTVYAVVTYGGMPAATINIFEKTLERYGGKLAAGFAVHMPGNYTPLYGAVAEEKQKKMFAKWNEKCKIVTEYMKANKRGKNEINNALVNFIFSTVFYNLSAKHIHEMDKDFWADEKCNPCGICQKVCPVANIELKNEKPTWKGRCEQCLACLHWCPEQAIQFGQKTAARKRYHHPEVELKDILVQAGN